VLHGSEAEGVRHLGEPDLRPTAGVERHLLGPEAGSVDGGLELEGQELEIDLVFLGESGLVDAFEAIETVSHLEEAPFVGLGALVAELVIEALVAAGAGIDRVFAEVPLDVLVEDGAEGVGGGGLGEGGGGGEAGGRNKGGTQRSQ
jgi:hypothetical protein